MFIPYRVDVPFNYRPVVNWVIVAGVIVVFCLQLPDLHAYSSQPIVITPDPNSESGFTLEAPAEMGGITGRWLLDGWSINGPHFSLAFRQRRLLEGWQCYVPAHLRPVRTCRSLQSSAVF